MLEPERTETPQAKNATAPPKTSMKNLNELIDALRLERAHQDRIYGDRNRGHGPGDWLGLIAGRIGHLATALSSRDFAWAQTECVKLAATALAVAQHLPGAQDSLGHEGSYTEIIGASTDRPKVHAKVSAPPADAVLVAQGVADIWIANGIVYVRR